MACKHCGYYTPVNPLKAAGIGLNHWMMMLFLDHVTPSADSMWGAANFFINWHWFMWWWCAIGCAVSATIAILTAGARLHDPSGYSQPRRGRVVRETGHGYVVVSTTDGREVILHPDSVRVVQ